MITTCSIKVLVQAQPDKSGFKPLRAYPNTPAFEKIANSDLDMFIDNDAGNHYDYFFMEVPMLLSTESEQKGGNPLEAIFAQYK